jgi:cell division initiation protein
MKTTSLDIDSIKLKKKAFGYDTSEVEALRKLASNAINDSAREINRLKEMLAKSMKDLLSHEEREDVLRKTITTAHEMSEGLKENASKEAEIIIAEARVRANEILMQANKRAADIQNEIFLYKRQRIDLEKSLRSILDYHSHILESSVDEARKADEDLETLKFFTK